jgi:hypothetical protein
LTDVDGINKAKIPVEELFGDDDIGSFGRMICIPEHIFGSISAHIALERTWHWWYHIPAARIICIIES